MAKPRAYLGNKLRPERSNNLRGSSLPEGANFFHYRIASWPATQAADRNDGNHYQPFYYADRHGPVRKLDTAQLGMSVMFHHPARGMIPMPAALTSIPAKMLAIASYKHGLESMSMDCLKIQTFDKRSRPNKEGRYRLRRNLAPLGKSQQVPGFAGAVDSSMIARTSSKTVRTYI